VYNVFVYTLQVQIKTSSCPYPYETAYCVHAVAVRVGQDVFVSDFKKPQTEFTLCNGGLLDRKVKKIGRIGFEVNLNFNIFFPINHKYASLH